MSNTPASALTRIAIIGTFLGVAAIAHAQGGLYAYPTKGQSARQQQQDAAECHQWAVQQTGFNRSAPQPPPSSAYAQASPPASSSPARGGLFGFGSGEGQGGMIADGARGTALGAIGGAIAGDAGEGAAIGAAASTVFGGIRRQARKQEEANGTNNSRKRPMAPTTTVGRAAAAGNAQSTAAATGQCLPAGLFGVFVGPRLRRAIRSIGYNAIAFRSGDRA